MPDNGGHGDANDDDDDHGTGMLIIMFKCIR